jgi:hypothetical protein
MSIYLGNVPLPWEKPKDSNSKQSINYNLIDELYTTNLKESERESFSSFYTETMYADKRERKDHLYSFDSEFRECYRFYDALADNKEYLMNTLDIEDDEYDKSPNKYDPFDIDEPLLTYSVIGGLCIVGGAVYAGINFAKANRLLKEYNSYVHSAPIFQENIKLGNGNMLSAGVDMLKSRNVGYTPGLGLRYNF